MALNAEELEKNKQVALKTLETSYIMYENSKKDLKTNAVKKTDKNGARIYTDDAIKKNLDLMETMQQDVVDKYVQLGGRKEDLLELGKKKKVDRKHLEELMKREGEKDEIAAYMSQMNKANTGVLTEPNKKSEIDTYLEQNVVETKENSVKMETNSVYTPEEVKQVQFEQNKEVINQFTQPQQPQNNNGKQRQMYDVISLPSGGQCYRHKMNKIRVSYLTAYDENMILSPNLYKDGGFLDYLLKAKVIDPDFNTDDLVQGDRDAIVIWLRGTGYGNDYPIVVTDDESGKDFETTIDLSTIKFKDFKLKGDENGYFDFVMPNSGDIIKFKFLTHKDIKFLDSLKKKESKKLTIENLRRRCNEIEDLIDDEELISYNAQSKIRDNIRIINEEITKNYDEASDLTFTHELTDRLLLQTVSVNGITDRKYINDYIITMNVKDAAAYRKYIIENEPGLDYTVEVERPQSLGGGSIKSFLRLDQFIFVNI